MIVIFTGYDGATQGVSRAGMVPRLCDTRRIKVENNDELDESTQTTAAGLTRLASAISELLREQAVDSRLGAKLLKRLEKEAKRVAEHGPAPLSVAEGAALRSAMEQLQHALHQRGADLLVQANARLRATEEAAGKRRKAKKEESA
jgi:hypothetical protein